MDLDAQLVGLVVVAEDIGAHLAAIVCEEDALAGLQAHAHQPAEAGPDQLSIAVLAAHLPAVEAHSVPSVRRQVYAVVVLRKRRRRLHRLNHTRVVQSILSERGDARPDDGALRESLAGRHGAAGPVGSARLHYTH